MKHPQRAKKAAASGCQNRSQIIDHRREKKRRERERERERKREQKKKSRRKGRKNHRSRKARK